MAHMSCTVYICFLYLQIQNLEHDDFNGFCNLNNGEEHILTFSDCYPDKFTCDSGACVALEARCNSLIDCEDKSDETNCQYLVTDESYSKLELPVAKEEQEQKPFQVRICSCS